MKGNRVLGLFLLILMLTSFFIIVPEEVSAQATYIQIRSESGGGGIDLSDPDNYETYSIGANYEIWGAMYNDMGDFIGEVPPSAIWSTSGTSIVNVDPPDGPSTNVFCDGQGSATITLEDGEGHINTTVVTVTSGAETMDSIIIRDEPDDQGAWVGPRTYEPGEFDNFFAGGYNSSTGMYMGDVDVTWTIDDPGVGDLNPPTGPTTEFMANAEGICIVTAEFNPGITNSTGILTVGLVDHVYIRDAPDGAGNIVNELTLDLSNDIWLWAAAYNSMDDYLYDVNVIWDSSDPFVAEVTSPGESTHIQPMMPGGCDLIMDYNAGVIVITIPIMVFDFQIDYIIIRDSPDGWGEPVGDRLYDLGGIDTFFAAGYNYSAGYLRDLEVSWSIDDPLVGDIVPLFGPMTDFIALESGICIVTADLGGGIINITGNLSVVAVDEIIIRDAPDGFGNPVMDVSLFIEDDILLWAAGYNSSIGYMGDVDVIWTCNDTDVGSVTSPGINTNFIPQGTGICYVMAYYDVGITNTTGDISIWTYTVDYITVRDSGGGGGSAVDDITYYIGDSDIFFAAGYNNTIEYLRDLEVSWQISNLSVGSIDTFGYTTNFSAMEAGICMVTGEYDIGISDSTGILTVYSPYNLTVDANGTAQYTSIQDAIDNAVEGNVIYVYHGLYNEHLTIDKKITLIGEDKGNTIIDGGGTGEIISITGDNVTIRGFTIQNGEYGIVCERVDSTLIHYNNIENYDYGIYLNQTTDVYVAHNTVTNGDYGIVTFEAFNDAIRFNTISYNTVYGAKDYNSQLKNCFNWNYIHNNNIAYYYDPDTPLSTLEFNGNILENNTIAIMVENASTISITNNTASGNEYGIYLINASPVIAYNNVRDSDFGIYAENSSSNITFNTINEILQYGIYIVNSDPLISNNTLQDISGYGIYIDYSTPVITYNLISGVSEHGIYSKESKSIISYNIIRGISESGIFAQNSSPIVSYNVMSDISGYGIYANSGDEMEIINNTLIECEMIFFNSTIKELWLIDSNITKINTTVEDYHLEANSKLEVKWFLRIRIVDEEGEPIENATVLIYDAYDNIITAQTSDSGGWVRWIQVTENFQNSTSTVSYNPFRIIVLFESLTNSSEISVLEDTTVTISLERKEAIQMPAGSSPFPWDLIIAVGFICAISLGGIFIEIIKYGILTLFIPLYSRIKKGEMLDQPTRFKIYGYIIGNPGANYGLIKQELALPNGQLVHHIRQLMHAHLIYSTEDGIRKRFYPVDFPKHKTGEHYFTILQEKILGIIKENSGISQKRIANSTGISRQVASYHLKIMEQVGAIKKEIVGRERKYYPSENSSA